MGFQTNINKAEGQTGMQCVRMCIRLCVTSMSIFLVRCCCSCCGNGLVFRRTIGLWREKAAKSFPLGSSDDVIVVVVVVVVFVIIYNKSKVEVCFNLGPLVMLTLVTRCQNQIKGNTFVFSNQTNSFPNVCNGLK